MSTSIVNHADDHPSSPSVTKTAVTPSPWTQIVRGESDMIGASAQSVVDFWSPPSSPPPPAESAAESSDNAKKQTVWNKPSNVAPIEVGSVMDAASWPALSDSTRASTKSSPDSVKVVPDDLPVSFDQVNGNVSLPSPRQNSANSKSNTNPNHTVPARQRSMRRNSSNTTSNNSIFELPKPLIPLIETPPNNHSPRESTKRSGFISQSHGANDHPHQRNAFKSRDGNQQPRGEGSHNHNHNQGGRRDKERENQDWNSRRSFTARDGSMQPQRVSPVFIRPPPQPLSPTPFITSPVRPFGSPTGFPELTSPVYYFPAPPPEALRGVPFVQQMPPQTVFFPAPDHYLHARIVSQIDYYFSNENLVRDTYLRQNMDDQGWVPINLIASFNKVKLLTENIQLILDAVRTSAVVEVQGDKIRKRNDWMRWTMPPVQLASGSSFQSLGMSKHDMLAAQMQGVALEEKTGNNNTMSDQADIRAEGFPSGIQSMESDHSNS